MSSSESKMSAPTTPATKKSSSDTSSVPTDLTVSSNERAGRQLQVTERIQSLEEELKLLKLEMKNKEVLLQMTKKKLEDTERDCARKVSEAEAAKKLSEESAKLRIEMQSKEMSKIQNAINTQLKEVTQRQNSLEIVNAKLRENADTTKQKLEALQYNESRIPELAKIRPADMSLYEFVEMMIYRCVAPEREKNKKLESYNLELNQKLEDITKDAAKLEASLNRGKGEKDGIQGSLQKKEMELLEIKKNLKELEGLNSALQLQIEKASIEQKHLEDVLSDRERTIQEHKIKIEALQTEIQSSSIENKSLSQSLVLIRQEFHEIKQKCDLMDQKSELGLSGLSMLTRSMQEKQLELLEQLSAGIFQNNLDQKYREQYLDTIKELVAEQIRTQQFVIRITKEREELETEVRMLTAKYKNAQMELLADRVELGKQREAIDEYRTKIKKLEHELSNIRSRDVTDVTNTAIDVKSTKEYRTLLRDMQLLLTHEDEISDIKELILKLQEDMP